MMQMPVKRISDREEREGGWEEDAKVRHGSHLVTQAFETRSTDSQGVSPVPPLLPQSASATPLPDFPTFSDASDDIVSLASSFSSVCHVDNPPPTYSDSLSTIASNSRLDTGDALKTRLSKAAFGANLRLNRIACLGAGYVGGPTMAVIASKCPHLQITVIDINEARIAAWNSDELPIYEPNLDAVVKACRGRNLFFSSDVAKGIEENDIIFVTVETPTKKTGLGAGAAADLSSWELAGRSIAEHAKSNKIIVEKSTVPVRTAEALLRVLQANEKHYIDFCILSNPEFLAEGSAITDLTAPDRVLIGGPEDTEAGRFSVSVVADIYKQWVDPERIISTNVWSSELSKLVANAFLAQRISSINAVANLCEKTGANVTEVARSIGLDHRIGSKFLQASLGFGGSCFQKDLLNLVYLCKSFNLPEEADYWSHVVAMNDHQKKTFATKIINAMFKTVRRKKIAVFGFAFKKDTGDTRETPAIDVCGHLLREEAVLHVYDPKVSRESALKEFQAHNLNFDFEKLFITESTPEAAVVGSHAIVVLTEWDEFKTLPWERYANLTERPAFVFDGRNILDHFQLWEYGFEVHAIGKSPLVHHPDSCRSK